MADTSRPDACANCGSTNLREVEWSGEWLCDDCDLITQPKTESGAVAEASERLMDTVQFALDAFAAGDGAVVPGSAYNYAAARRVVDALFTDDNFNDIIRVLGTETGEAATGGGVLLAARCTKHGDAEIVSEDGATWCEACVRESVPQHPPTEERKVLVGRIYSSLSTTWSEWKDSFDDVVQKMSEKRTEQAPKVTGDEIIEVIVVRRARITSTVMIEEV